MAMPLNLFLRPYKSIFRPIQPFFEIGVVWSGRPRGFWLRQAPYLVYSTTGMYCAYTDLICEKENGKLLLGNDDDYDAGGHRTEVLL